MNAALQPNTERSECDFTHLDLPQQFQTLKALYQAEPATPLKSRLTLLSNLKALLLTNQDRLADALSRDYGFRSDFDSVICDLLPAVQHINYTLKKLPKWVKPSKRHAGLMLFPSKVFVHYQPLGVVGVIVPWNFPIVLSIAPVVTALAAGNRVMVKLSEHTPNTNGVLKSIFANFSDHVVCIEGEAEVAAEFSALPFDHLLFTGSTPVGKLVAKAAAPNLTPITLELGGKSPVIIAPDVDLVAAADAIMLGKSINAGQICVAPDYVLLPKGKEREFIDIYLGRFKRAYMKKNKEPQITHIINETQRQRLQQYIEDAKEKGALVDTLQDCEAQGREMLPHLLSNVSEEMLVCQHEIFGPILPVKTYESLNEAINYVNNKPRPLALYLMSNDKTTKDKILAETHSGTTGINETLLQIAAEDAPFGGVGQSGMGRYHGIEGFQTFSHAKTVLDSPSWLPRSKWALRYKALMSKALSRLFLR
ncbi:coniferyl aldehyde dehydrogenase [Vibrio sp. T187]|uniref:coniferyl aldehyde dehydrogenase n=1 Tax=Vibrio TaxID=662 RepID=UPI0010C9E9BC|nr:MULTISPECIES: coniferyl aldehyde dehydrogenase [Vibrio]MBW3695868.1 coniferyl aldehyde dehydrogenase [Vibrio sp. T187]